MIYLKNPQQIECMRKAGALLYDVLCRLREAIKPGMSTAELDVYAEQLIRKHKAIPSFLDYNGYPASICTSINEEVVHGIPSDRVILKDGDVLSVDCGLILDGWQSDSAFTVGVGNVSPEDQKLINVTEECFFKGVRKALNGNHLGDIGHAVQTYAESFGYGVIRDLTGHGIGRNMHEEPSVAQLRKGRPRREAASGNDPCHRAYDRQGRLSCGRAGRRLDRRNGGFQRLLPLRAHDRHQRKRSAGAPFVSGLCPDGGRRVKAAVGSRTSRMRNARP